MAKKSANKKKSSHGNKVEQENHGESGEHDVVKGANKGQFNGTSAVNGESSGKRASKRQSSKTRTSMGQSTGTAMRKYGLWIAVAVSVVIASVILMHEGTQLYIVQLTGAGSNPLQYVNSARSASPASESNPAGPTSESVPGTPTSDSVPGTPSSDSVPGTPTSDSVQETPGSESVQEQQTTESVPGTPTSESVQESQTSQKTPDHGKPGATSESIPSSPTSEPVPERPTSESAAQSPTRESVQPSPTSEPVPLSPTSESAPVSPSPESDEILNGAQTQQKVEAEMPATGGQEPVMTTSDTAPSSDGGKAPSVEDGDAEYPYRNITTDEEMEFRNKLDSADAYRNKKEYQKALDRYNNILRRHGSTPRTNWGKGMVTLAMANQQLSNALLEEAINLLDMALRGPDTPKALMTLIAPELTHWMQFRGWNGRVVKTWKYLLEIFPDNIEYYRLLGTAYLTIGKEQKAEEVFKHVLEYDPNDGFALVHLGFVASQAGDYESCIDLFSRGLATDAEGTQDGKFYARLGDAYIRLKQPEKAKEVFIEGERRGLLLSRDQRSMYNADKPLTARPFWTPEQTGFQDYIDLLEAHWEIIRDEALAVFNSTLEIFIDPSEHLLENERKGDWKQYTFYRQGQLHKDKCTEAPKTCQVIRQIDPATSCTRGQIKFSVMQGGIHVWPHTGPTNCRLRAHLGLVVPEGPRIRVGNDTRTWEEGKVFIFDDSFEHEVWHHGKKPRIVLIVDFWHPELSEREKRMLTPI